MHFITKIKNSKAFRLINNSSNLKFVLLLILLSVVYDYPSILFKRPQSVHHWRQSDCTSLALNYYQTGMHFFKPQTHNLISDNNKTGYVATSEVPVGYYFIAILYKIFGYHDYIYRIVNTLIFLIGLFFLFKTMSLLIDGFFWPAFASLLFFTSPVLVYYGNNFLTDSSALAFSMMAWYFFVKFYLKREDESYYISMLFFLLAGMYKITALISLVALFGAFIGEVTGIIKFRQDKKIFPKPFVQFLPFLAISLIIGTWVCYARYYNHLHGTGYFSTGIFPFWDNNHEEIHKILENVKVLWLKEYFHILSLYLMLIVFILNLVFVRKNDRFLFFTMVLMFIGTIAYVILWFSTFKDHDYYTINLYILLIFNILAFCWWASRSYKKIFYSRYAKILFFTFFVVNAVHANQQMNARYHGWMTEYPEYKDYHTISSYLRSIGIRDLDTAICLPDKSHFTLYLMNLRGWTECMGLNKDSASIMSSISNGAKYLIINGNETLGRKYLQSFLTQPIGQFGQVHIFKLKSYKAYSEKKVVKATPKMELIFCDAEKISEDGKLFLTTSENYALEGGKTQSAEKAYEGKYSSKLTRNDAFSMICRISGVEPGEHFIASVYRYSATGKGLLVASTNAVNEFYLNQPSKIEKMKDGWEKLTLDFYVYFKPKDSYINVYIWNNGDASVYFDNLTVERYKPDTEEH